MNKKTKIKKVISHDIKLSSKENNVLDNAQKELNEIIQLLILNRQSFDEELFRQKLSKYMNSYHRILYSSVSIIIYESYQNGQNEYIDNSIQNLTKIVNNMKITSNMTEEDKVILKLLDHVLLANQQLSSLEVTSEKINPFIEGTLKKVDKRIKIQTDKVNSLKNNVKKDIDKQKDSLISQMISIVSIFVGISFVMFGGMTLLNNLFDFSNMSYVPVTELLCLGSLIGIIMICIIYAFMIFILRITDKYKNISGKSLLNGVLISMLIILVLICSVTFSLWKNNKNQNGFNSQTQEKVLDTKK